MQAKASGAFLMFQPTPLPCLNVWSPSSTVGGQSVAIVQCPSGVGVGCPPTAPGRQKFLCLWG